MLRTMQLFLETTIGFRVPSAHPIMTWLVSHSADVLTQQVLGIDGKSAYHRIRGRAFGGRTIAFGENCRYKLRSKEPLNGRDIWSEGLWLGRCKVTGQNILHDNDLGEVAYSRRILRVPNTQK